MNRMIAPAALAALLWAMPVQAQTGIAQQADEAFARKDCKAAIPLYRQELSKGVPRARAQFRLGWCLNELKQHNEALPWLIAAAKADQSTPVFPQEVGYTYNRLGQYRPSIEWYRKALEIAPTDDAIMVSIAEGYYQLDEYEPAIEWFAKAVARKQQSGVTYQHYGYSLNHQQRYAEALPLLEKAVELSPKWSLAAMELAFSHEKLKHFDEAQTWYAKAAELDPKSALALTSIGGLWLDLKKDCPTAMTWYRKALAIEANERKANFGMGYCLNAQLLYSQAVPYLESAIRTDPKYAAAYIDLGYSHKQLGNLALAETNLQQGNRLNPRDANGRYYLAQVYVVRRDKPAAQRVLTELRAIRPDLADKLQAQVDGL